VTQDDELRPHRFTIEPARPRGFEPAFVQEGAGGLPLLLVHGWPETKRIFWRNVGPLSKAGFEVIAPDLRGFGDSELAPDVFCDVPAHSRDLYALVRDPLGHSRVVAAGGDLGGPVIQDLSLRYARFGPFLVRDAGQFLQWEAAEILNSAVRAFCQDLLPT
jgi:pimeloyl-ACP methyl ester carboxylesterase